MTKKTPIKVSFLLNYSSTVVDERNFDPDDTESILGFNQKYADDKYRCFQVVLND